MKNWCQFRPKCILVLTIFMEPRIVRLFFVDNFRKKWLIWEKNRSFLENQAFFVHEILKNPLFSVCLSMSEKLLFCLSIVCAFWSWNFIDMSFCPWAKKPSYGYPFLPYAKNCHWCEFTYSHSTHLISSVCLQNTPWSIKKFTQFVPYCFIVIKSQFCTV